MNKKELKQAFEKEFKNITVSKELKEKTLNKINIPSIKKASHIPYLRNFAAVFVVTLLCCSIYWVNLSQKNNIKTFESPTTSKSTLDSTKPEAASRSMKSSISTQNMASDASIEDLSLNVQKSLPEKTILQDTYNLEENSINSISEKTFLELYPNAEKIDGGYVIYENEKETLYIFKNGALENMIIIN